MRALVYTSNGKVDVCDWPEPVPAHGEAVVEVKLVGICGSDLLGFQGRSPGRVPPMVLGHEFTGRVAGRPVVVNPIVACGHCEPCRSGKENLCRTMRLLGLHSDGAMRERIAAPLANLLEFDPGTRDEVMALAEPLACAVQSVAMVPEPAQARSLIIGFGCLGTMIATVLRHLGVAHFQVLDKAEARAAMASRFGGRPATPETIKPESVEVVYDCAGYAATRRLAARALVPGGHLVLVGYGEMEGGINFTDVVRRELHLHGVMAYTAARFRRAVELLKEGVIDTDGLVRVFPLGRGQEAFELAQKADSGVIKTFLKLSDEG